MDIKKIKTNPNNPRIIKSDKFKKLCKSIKDFPKMMSLRPIVVDKDMMILGGNMRFKAIQTLGLKLQDDWVKIADELTEDEKKRFIVEDNLPFGEFNYDDLLNWDFDELKDWGFSENDFNINIDKYNKETKEKLCPNCGHKL